MTVLPAKKIYKDSINICQLNHSYIYQCGTNTTFLSGCLFSPWSAGRRWFSLFLLRQQLLLPVTQWELYIVETRHSTVWTCCKQCWSWSKKLETCWSRWRAVAQLLIGVQTSSRLHPPSQFQSLIASKLHLIVPGSSISIIFWRCTFPILYKIQASKTKAKMGVPKGHSRCDFMLEVCPGSFY